MAKKQITEETPLQKFQKKAKLDYKTLTSLSDEDVINTPYDKNWREYNEDEFFTIDYCIGDTSYSEECYVIYVQCKNSGYEFFNIRIVPYDYIDGVYSFFICRAIKITEGEMAKKEVPAIVNKLGLVKGQVISVDDIELKFTNENSYYDKRLKKRVFKKNGVSPELKEIKDEKISVQEKLSIKNKAEGIVLDNTDEKTPWKSHSSGFLIPQICTRIWTLGIGLETGWGWFAISETKYSFRYYCRPIEISEDWQKQYDRGGDFITNAYYIKPDFEKMVNPALTHELIMELWKQYKQAENSVLTLNCLIDAYLIDWKDKY